MSTGVFTDRVQAFDLDSPRCREHRGIPAHQMLACALCGEARAWADRRRLDLVRADVERRLVCPMCDSTGQRWEPDTHRAVVPLTTCDHDTAHAAVVASLVERERAAELARAARPPLPPVPSTPGGRARARELFRPKRQASMSGSAPAMAPPLPA